ncbi:MAG: hypothetical protein HYX69_10045 [Planctomycetia bacterium]|nr:hypothetical protein [Planctomycetia bacterium]
MARQEEHREDVLAEATALVERAEIVDADGSHIVLGFRRDGAASLYRGDDPVYHFTSDGHLRRAYIGGQLYKAEFGKLVALTRKRTDTEVQLVRHELSADEMGDLLDELKHRLERLAATLDANRYRLAGQAPATVDVPGRFRRLLDQLSAGIEIAASPRVA